MDPESDAGASGDGDTGGASQDTRGLRERQLEAVARAGVAIPQDVDMDVWLAENTAARFDGTIIVLAQADTSESAPPAPEQHTATQQAVLEGNPNIPANIHRAIMNPVGAKSIFEDHSVDKLEDPAYRKRLAAELGKVPSRELTAALGERTDLMWESREYDGLPQRDVAGDLLAAN